MSTYLTPSSHAVVKATLPVIGAAIGDITPVFYRRLFAALPELERDLFNRANQAQGTQQQALAAAVAAYATLLIAEDGPEPRVVLSRIAHKHASLGVLKEHYPIVHEHLFAAIVEVLGDAVTPEIAAAWDEVYWHMANALIEIEARLYAEAGVAPGEVWRKVVITRRQQVSPSTISLTLADPAGLPLPTARPGQYVSVSVRLPDGARQIRQYSLTATADPASYTISVKAISEGTAAGEVSTFLHFNALEGSTLSVSAPFGENTLPEGEHPIVLISAGIGVTPTLGFLHHLRESGSTREVLVLHADRSAAHHAHRHEIDQLVEALPGATLQRWYEYLGVHAVSEQLHNGRLDLAAVDLPANADIYLCGPVPFMAITKRALNERGIDSARIHIEVFGPGLDVVA